MSELVRDPSSNVIGVTFEAHPDTPQDGPPAFMFPVVVIPEGSTVGEPKTEDAATEAREDAATAAQNAAYQAQIADLQAQLAAAQGPPPAPVGPGIDPVTGLPVQ